MNDVSMTLRDLINAVMDTGNWNRVTSIIYDTYYTENDSRKHVDQAYIGALAELLDLPHNKQDISIVIEQCTTVIPGRDDQSTIEKYVDVRLQQPTQGPCSVNYVEWTELIDMIIDDQLDLNIYEQLAHVLWEITFHGFSNQSVKQAIQDLTKQIDQIEKNSDNLIEFDPDLWDKLD